MSTTGTIHITVTEGEWYVRPTDGSCYEICRASDDEVISIADENGDAALMSCTKNFLEALISIQDLITTNAPDDTPLPKQVITTSEIGMIVSLLNATFSKLANEVSA